MNFIKNKLREKDKFFYKDYFRAITILTLFSLAYNFYNISNIYIEIFEVILFLYIALDLFLGFNFDNETKIKHYEMIEVYVISFPISVWLMFLSYYSLIVGDIHLFGVYSVLTALITSVSLSTNSLLDEYEEEEN